MSADGIMQFLLALLAAATVGMLVFTVITARQGRVADEEDFFARIEAFREYGVLFGLPPSIAAGSLLALLVLVFVFLATIQGGGFAFWGVLLIAAGLALFSRSLRGINRARYLKTFENQLPMVADQTVSAVRGGKTLTQGLALLPGQLPEPASSEMRELSERTRLGAGGIEAAIEEMSAKYDSKHLALLLSVFGIFARQGGNIVEPMQKISSAFKDVWRAQQAIESAGAGAKATFWIINCAVLGIFTFLSLAAPDMLSQIFTNIVGILLFVVGVGIYVLGAYIMRQMLRADV